MQTVTATYAIKYELEFAPHYVWLSNDLCYNLKTGRFVLLGILLVIGLATMMILSILLYDIVNSDLKPLFYSVVFANILLFGNFSYFTKPQKAQKNE